MKWRVINTHEFEDWNNLLQRFPRTDIYYLPEYHGAYEVNGDGTGFAFVAERGDETLFYPFFMCPIEMPEIQPPVQAWYDIQTVYGYAGPISTTSEKSFLEEAWSNFGAWCRSRNIVAEFIRFNPLLGNNHYASSSYKVTRERETVVVDLNYSESEFWTRYPQVQRNMVRKAVRKGLVCSSVPLAEGRPEFMRLYRATMERLEAKSQYFFSTAYFDYLFDTLAERLKIFVVRAGEKVIAAAIFLTHGDYIHYHLAGSDPAHIDAAPNNLLLHTVAQWARSRGFHCFHLGGGRTPEADDKLLRFKASISRARLPFYIGRKIHHQAMYDQLCAQWMDKAAISERPAYFLLYRLEKGD